MSEEASEPAALQTVRTLHGANCDSARRGRRASYRAAQHPGVAPVIPRRSSRTRDKPHVRQCGLAPRSLPRLHVDDSAPAAPNCERKCQKGGPPGLRLQVFFSIQ